MTPSETAQLLAVIQTFDRRTVGETDVLAWHATLKDEPFEDCRDAVIRHYGDSTDWLMPAHVRRGARLARRVRMAELEKFTPDADPDDPRAYIRALRGGQVKQDAGSRALPPLDSVFPAIPGGEA